MIGELGASAEQGAPRRAWLPPLLIAILFAFQTYAFHWGVIAPDTVFQWGQALSGHYDDWHPPATTWLWRQLMRCGPGSAPVLLCDLLLYWAGVWLIADTLRRRGRPWAMAAAILVAALPIPFGQMGAILKDPLLAACCLVACGLLFAFGQAAGRGRAMAAALAFALLLFATATRFNAMFATAPLLAAWLPRRQLATPGRHMLALGGCAALLAGGGWVIDNPLLQPHHARPIFSLVNFDLGGIAAHGGAGAYPNFDRATERRLTTLCYHPSLYNGADLPECEAVEDHLVAYADAHGLGASTIWLGAVIHAPGGYLLHRFAHLNRNWRFLVASVPDDAVYMMTTANDFGLHFAANRATLLVVNAARVMAVSPFGRPVTWIAIAIGLVIASAGLPSRRFVMANAVSTILYGAAYAVCSVAPDLRYNLWTLMGTGMALVVTAAELGDAPSPKGRLMLAAAPAAIVMGMECFALLFGWV